MSNEDINISFSKTFSHEFEKIKSKLRNSLKEEDFEILYEGPLPGQVDSNNKCYRFICDLSNNADIKRKSPLLKGLIPPVNFLVKEIHSGCLELVAFDPLESWTNPQKRRLEGIIEPLRSQIIRLISRM